MCSIYLKIFVTCLLVSIASVHSSVLSASTARTVTVECDTEGNKTSCTVTNSMPLDFDSELMFINVPNVTEIAQLKLVATHNAIDIPHEIFDTFINLQSLELAIGLQKIQLNSGKRLKQLLLCENRVDRITSGVFANATDLIEINLQKNQIVDIEESAFAGLDQLHNLILFRNHLKNLRRGIFSGAPNLKSIDLAFNEIETIDDGVFDLPKLEEILISDNRLKSLNEHTFRGAVNLQNLDMRKNLLETIGQSLYTLRHLYQLQLADNERLNDLNIFQFIDMPSLAYLGIEGIGLHQLSSETTVRTATNSSRLRTLSLSRNKLSSIDFFRQLNILENLEELYVDSNRFTRWNDNDVSNVKKYFPNIDLIVTKDNAWDRKWAENVLIPTFKANNIFCNQFKYLGVFIFGFRKNGDQQVIDGTECV